LEMGLKAKLYGISFTEALAMVKHTTTYGSFERLLNKEVDMIFSTPLSPEQNDQAAKGGMDLELVPVASEAFVFIVNADNPVDSLTQQQIKDIYSGKITNWKEVGGNDIEIVAFQRNRTSGSQNYMNQFMGDVKLMDAPYEQIPHGMNSLVEAVKSYDNSENAIGYSVYAYAADMYGLGDTLKFIKVDGVEPTKETIASKEYPLVNFNYLIYDRNSATEAVVKTAEWISSTDGQTAIAEAGYVPYANVHREYLELTGTGKPKPENYQEPITEYTAVSVKTNSKGYVGARNDINVYEIEDSALQTYSWKINGIADKELEAEINKKLSELKAKYEAMLPAANQYIDTLKRLSTHTFNGTASHIYKDYYYDSYSGIDVTVKNGYMCIVAGAFYSDGADRPFCYSSEAVYYDLIKGEEISFTDLFYEGIDIDEALYSLLTDRPLGSYNYEFYNAAVAFSDISKLKSTDHFSMSFDKIYFNYNNPIFCVGEMLEISLDRGYLCVEEPDPMEGIFDSSFYVKMSFALTHTSTEYEDISIGDKYEMRVKMLSETGDFAERNKKINDFVRKYVAEEYSIDKVTDYYLKKGLTLQEIEDYSYLTVFYNDNTLSLTEYSDEFVLLARDYLDDEIFFIFDGKTGDVIEISDLLKEGWQNNIKIFNSRELYINHRETHTPEETAAIEMNILPENAKLYSFTHYLLSNYIPTGGKVYLPLAFVCIDSGLEISVFVDSDYVKGFAD
ncbi:MAG: substrate-binding domain-containing protein, partial [Clostridia bacterium]|nr:substrate-binding domain-containing protein [Clostridia bacterium]